MGVRGVRALYLCTGGAIGTFYPFIWVILLGHGFSVEAVGAVAAISAVVLTLAVPTWGHVADVLLGRPRALQIAIGGAAVALLITLGPVPDLVLATCFVGFAFFESAFGPLSDALAVNAVRDPRRDYARVRLLSSLAFAPIVVAAGFLYDRTGYGPAPVLFAILALAAIVSAAFVPDVERADLHAIAADETGDEARVDANDGARGGARARRGRLPTWRLGSVGVALSVVPRLPLALLAIFLIHVGILAGWTFLAVRLRELGASPHDIALSSGVSATAEVPAFLLLSIVGRRLGVRTVFTLAAILYCGCFVAWTFLADPGLIIATRIGTGIAFAAITSSAVLTIATLLPDRLQATGQALYQTTAFGLAAILANVTGGIVYGVAGPGMLFGGAAVLGLLAALVGWFVLPRRAAWAVPAAPIVGPGLEPR
ncbi:MAG: MFS transporter [Candidatus Limnocylindrales bacterium]